MIVRGWGAGNVTRRRAASEACLDFAAAEEPMILKVLVTVGVAMLALLGISRVRARRRRDALPELNKHPERLEQMLDRTDDA